MGNSQKLGQKSVSPLIETKNSRRKVAQFSAAQLALARPPVREQAMWRVARLALRAIEQCLQIPDGVSHSELPPTEPTSYGWASNPGKVEIILAMVGRKWKEVVRQTMQLDPEQLQSLTRGKHDDNGPNICRKTSNDEQNIFSHVQSVAGTY